MLIANLKPLSAGTIPSWWFFPFRAKRTRWSFAGWAGGTPASWLSKMLAGSLPVNPDTNDYLDATVGLRKYSDQPIPLVDALLARVTRRLEARSTGTSYNADDYLEIRQGLTY